MMGLHIGRSPAYSAEMMPDRCCINPASALLISEPLRRPPPTLQAPPTAAFAS
jgi:hypothetical protein